MLLYFCHTDGHRFYPVEGVEARHQVIDALASSPEAIDKIGKFFYEATRKLIATESVSLVGAKAKTVDIVREVFRVVPVQWLAADIVSVPPSYLEFLKLHVC